MWNIENGVPGLEIFFYYFYTARASGLPITKISEKEQFLMSSILEEKKNNKCRSQIFENGLAYFDFLKKLTLLNKNNF